MDDFTYINIYATKGVEYLWVILYLVVLAGFGPILMRLGRKSSVESNKDNGQEVE